MKKILPLYLLASLASLFVAAQCGGGKVKCALNWDYLQFFPSAGIGSYTNLAQSQTQNFAFGTQKVTITHNYTGSNAVGEDGTHTGETSSFGTGDDLHFIGNGTITFTFAAAVDSIKFSLYDVDRSQRVVVSSPGVGTIVNMMPVSTTNLTVTNNLTSAARVDAGLNTYANNTTTGTVNVVITNPAVSVTTFTITVSNTGTNFSENGDFWISDITACSAGAFTPNYFAVSKPFTNQGGYIVTSRNDSFYFVNPANGVAKYIFHDSTGLYANSVAYDPVRHEIYYAFSLTLPGPAIDPNNKTLKRYNYDKDTFGVVIPDVSIFAPVFEQGIESGAAAFYDGSLYLGLEASASGANESTVWKIDFNASGNPTGASQVYSIPGSGHDWGDIAVVNGTLVDFDSRPTAANYFHQDLYTKAVTVYTPATVDLPRQAAVDWNNNIYNIGGSGNSYVVGGVTIATGTIVKYNGNGTINTAAIDTIKYNNTAEMGSWGDAGEAFRPRVDYGDAPASYDPATGDPAVHEITSTLYLGTNLDDEWSSRGQTSLANSDNYDDGMISGSLVNGLFGSYYCNVKFVNKTGTTATICAWIDFNNNGKFDPAEGITKTLLPSSPSVQNIFLTWSGVPSTLVAGSFTYLRVRITTTANGMTVNNPTGFYDIGEVEDFRLAVTTTPLVTDLISFDVVKKAENNVSVNWSVANEEAGMRYTVQRSSDGTNWTNLSSEFAATNGTAGNYTYEDSKPLRGVSYYRLQLAKDAEKYSETKRVGAVESLGLRLIPNPASNTSSLQVNCVTQGTASIKIYDVAGNEVLQQSLWLYAGSNTVALDLSKIQSGVYCVLLRVNDELQTQRLLIHK